MEAVVVDVGSKLLKAGLAIPDQSPPLVLFLSALFYPSILLEKLTLNFNFCFIFLNFWSLLAVDFFNCMLIMNYKSSI